MCVCVCVCVCMCVCVCCECVYVHVHTVLPIVIFHSFITPSFNVRSGFIQAFVQPSFILIDYVIAEAS